MTLDTRLRETAGRTIWRASRAITVPTRRFRNLPDFMIIGAERCGTTSLYRYLEQHPAVVPAVLCKGVHYFDVNHERGDAWYRSHFPSRQHMAAVTRRSGQPAITGEASPYYLFHPAVPARVATLLLDVRLIVMLRDPVSRAYSQYQHEVARGFESLTFEDALRSEQERLAGEAERLCVEPGSYSFSHQHHSYVSRGMYADQLRRWMERFPRARIMIVDSGDFFRDPARGYQDVLAFLGLRHHALKLYPSLNSHRYQPMSPEARSHLEAVFHDPDRALSSLLGRRLSWNEPRSSATSTGEERSR